MILTIANEKGGQGKSTTAAAIASGAIERGYKVLTVDLDPQANQTFSAGGDSDLPGAYDVLTGAAKASDVIQHTQGGDLIASSPVLVQADSTFTGDERTIALKNALKPLKRKYDLIVIDTPPNLGILLTNALIASDSVLIPMTADIWAIQGLYELISTVFEVKDLFNPRLKITGVLIVRYSPRLSINRNALEVIEETCSDLKIKVFDTKISEAVAIRESQIMQVPIFKYAPKSKPAIDYMNLLDEIGLTGKE